MQEEGGNGDQLSYYIKDTGAGIVSVTYSSA